MILLVISKPWIWFVIWKDDIVHFQHFRCAFLLNAKQHPYWIALRTHGLCSQNQDRQHCSNFVIHTLLGLCFVLPWEKVAPCSIIGGRKVRFAREKISPKLGRGVCVLYQYRPACSSSFALQMTALWSYWITDKVCSCCLLSQNKISHLLPLAPKHKLNLDMSIK